MEHMMSGRENFNLGSNRIFNPHDLVKESLAQFKEKKKHYCFIEFEKGRNRRKVVCYTKLMNASKRGF